MKWYPDRIEMLHEQVTGKRCAEIGVRSGAYSKFIAMYDPEKLYLIDIWKHQDDQTTDGVKYIGGCNADQEEQDRLYEWVKKRFRGEKNVKVIREWSHKAAEQFKDRSLDWVYIDANHAYKACIRDIRIWEKKVKKGGLVCGHDYVNEVHPDGEIIECKRAVDDFLRKTKRELEFLTTEESPSWGFVV